MPGGSDGKDLPAMQETQVRSLGWEDPLEKDIATHSSILAGRILWIEEPGGLSSMRSERVSTTERLTLLHLCSDAGRDRGQEEKGTTEVEMAGWHH